MPELYAPAIADNTRTLCNGDPELQALFLQCNPHASRRTTTLSGNQFYDISLDPSPASLSVVRQLNNMSPSARERLMVCTAEYGQETTRLASFYDRFLADLDLWELGEQASSGLGMSVTAVAGRAQSFQGALRDYQAALILLNRFKRSGKQNGALRSQLRQNVIGAYEHLNRHFHQELKALVPDHFWGKNKGTALTGAERGITLAERNKGRRIRVADRHQGRQVAEFSEALKYTGRGLLALDAGFRIKKVYDKYDDGKDWGRELAAQTGGMAGSSGAGFLTGRAVLTLSRIALATTPWGWAILIGSSVAMGVVLANQADAKGQWMAGRLWDRLF